MTSETARGLPTMASLAATAPAVAAQRSAEGVNRIAPDEHPFVEQIDHVGIHVDDAEGLFRFFTERLALPMAFPFVSFPAYSSGGVVLGNMFLEVMRFGAAPRRRRSLPEARYLILGFLVRPGSLAEAAAELDRRGLLRSGIAPFFAPAATDHEPIVLWENVFLGHLLGHNGWTRLFFAASRRLTPWPSTQRSRLAATLLPPLLRGAFPTGMPVLTDYRVGYDARKRAADAASLREAGGGALGLLAAREVTVGVPASGTSGEAWERFLAPVTPAADGTWQLGTGPRLRLVPRPRPSIAGLELVVASLERAEAALRRLGIPARVDGEALAVQVPGTSDLTMRLTEG